MTMAKKDKKIPKYMQKPVDPTPAVYNAGNHSRQFTIQVPVLNIDGTIKMDENQNVVVEEKSEIYEWNQKHRNQHKAGSGLWTVPECVEGLVFLNCRQSGAFTHWKSGTHKGWGVRCNKGQALVIGQGVSNNNQMTEVKVCKFVEGNKGRWHGYPIDYRKTSEDIICDNALFYWERMRLIDKSDISDIQNKEDSPLV